MTNLEKLKEFINSKGCDNVFVDRVISTPNGETSLYSTVSTFSNHKVTELMSANLNRSELKDLFNLCEVKPIKFRNFEIVGDEVRTAQGVFAVSVPEITEFLSNNMTHRIAEHEENLMSLFSYLIFINSLIVCDRELDRHLTVYKHTAYMSEVEFSMKKLSANIKYIDKDVNQYRNFWLVKADYKIEVRPVIRILVKSDEYIKDPLIADRVLGIDKVVDENLGDCFIIELNLTEINPFSYSNIRDFIETLNIGYLHRTVFLAEYTDCKLKAFQFGKKMYNLLNGIGEATINTDYGKDTKVAYKNPAVLVLQNNNNRNMTAGIFMNMLLNVYFSKALQDSSAFFKMFREIGSSEDAETIVDNFLQNEIKDLMVIKDIIGPTFAETYIKVAGYGYKYYQNSIKNGDNVRKLLFKDLSISRALSQIELQEYRFNLYDNVIMLPDNYNTYTTFCPNLKYSRS